MIVPDGEQHGKRYRFVILNAVNGCQILHAQTPAFRNLMRNAGMQCQDMRTLRWSAGVYRVCKAHELNGHGGAGENPAEIHAFAEHLLKDSAATPLLAIADQGRDGNRVWVRWESSHPIRQAELNFTRDSSAPWENRLWETIPAPPGVESAEATLPDETLAYFWNVIDARDLIISAEHVESPQGDALGSYPN